MDYGDNWLANVHIGIYSCANVCCRDAPVDILPRLVKQIELDWETEGCLLFHTTAQVRAMGQALWEKEQMKINQVPVEHPDAIIIPNEDEDENGWEICLPDMELLEPVDGEDRKENEDGSDLELWL